MNKKTVIYLPLFILLCALSVHALTLPIGAQKVIESQQQLALSITFLIAFLGGILSFTSPCGFVLIPTFFSYLFKERKRALFMTTLFSLGMTLGFVTFGVIAAAVGDFFNIYKETFAMISGLILILFGILLILNKGFFVFTFHIKHKPNNGITTFFLGLFFAIGWTPCIGPILGGILVLAAGTASLAKGAILLMFYSLGVALPLLIVSYFSDKLDLSKYFTSTHVTFSLFGKKIYTHLYGIIAGTILISLGLVMFFDRGTEIFMEKIPNYLPWTMELYVKANNATIHSTLFTNTFANTAAALFALAVILFIFFQLRKKR